MYNDLKMNIVQIEIDNGSGFCFGVTTAIKKAEEELAKGGKLYCLGDIVHNGMEVERLHEAGLITIDHEQMEELQGVKVLLRAHGEPPETYALAERNNIEIIGYVNDRALLQELAEKFFDNLSDSVRFITELLMILGNQNIVIKLSLSIL